MELVIRFLDGSIPYDGTTPLPPYSADVPGALAGDALGLVHVAIGAMAQGGAHGALALQLVLAR
jgi:hypothetical protein